MNKTKKKLNYETQKNYKYSVGGHKKESDYNKSILNSHNIKAYQAVFLQFSFLTLSSKTSNQHILSHT